MYKNTHLRVIFIEVNRDGHCGINDRSQSFNNDAVTSGIRTR